MTQLKHDVDVFGILKEVLEANNVVMMKRTMNLDLRHELLLGAGLCERCLRNDLGRSNSLGFNVSELVTLGETTFSEELPAQVLLDANITVELDDFFLDDNLRVVLLILGRLSRGLLLLHLFS